MSKFLSDAATHSLLKPVLLALCGVAVVGMAIGLNLLHPGDDDQKQIAPQASSQQQPVAPDAQKPGSGFDVVRVNNRGDAVLAGRAEPRSEVTLKTDGEAIGTVTADARGEWVFIPETPLSPGPHRLSGEERREDGSTRNFTEDVMILVPAPGDESPDGTPPQALAFKLSADGSTTILQGVSALSGNSSLAIDAAEERIAGTLTFTGRALPHSRIRITLDGVALGETRAESDGRWSLQVPRSQRTGTGALAVEQIDATGAVLARIDVPLPASAVRPVKGQVVVQRGDNLWQIAREIYGHGTSFTVIYEANRLKITDPNRIYPGQQFLLPQLASNAPGEENR